MNKAEINYILRRIEDLRDVAEDLGANLNLIEGKIKDSINKDERREIWKKQ